MPHVFIYFSFVFRASEEKYFFTVNEMHFFVHKIATHFRGRAFIFIFSLLLPLSFRCLSHGAFSRENLDFSSYFVKWVFEGFSVELKLKRMKFSKDLKKFARSKKFADQKKYFPKFFLKKNFKTNFFTPTASIVQNNFFK